ncbi:UNVERIFIED_CONTAM: hypothetical protein GTU68_041505 [Idotea baltica]|nr:hypothetical protein [Idotea baltica]
MKLNIKRFDELTCAELYLIIQARIDVFVVEQICPYPDLDDRDQDSIHVWLSDQGVLAAYARVLSPDQTESEFCSIGRIVTTTAFRGKGMGKKIVSACIGICEAEFNQSPIKISGQLYLKKFYEEFKFRQIDNIYLEDGIPHIAMIREASE